MLLICFLIYKMGLCHSDATDARVTYKEAILFGIQNGHK